MTDPIEAQRPANRVPPHELPAALRDAGLMNWIREPLDDAVDRRRRIIVPPAAAVMGTPASAYQGTLLAEARHPDTVFMMGDNPALPTMPERPVLKDFFQLRLSKIGASHLLQSAGVAAKRRLPTSAAEYVVEQRRAVPRPELRLQLGLDRGAIRTVDRQLHSDQALRGVVAVAGRGSRLLLARSRR